MKKDNELQLTKNKMDLNSATDPLGKTVEETRHKLITT